jgi:hypothetical protein
MAIFTPCPVIASRFTAKPASVLCAFAARRHSERPPLGRLGLEVDFGLPARALQFAFGAARHADVGKLLAQDAEARRVDVEVGGHGETAGEMFATELHRGASGGVAHGAGEAEAGLPGRRGGVQDEADGTGGDGAGVLGRDFHA